MKKILISERTSFKEILSRDFNVEQNTQNLFSNKENDFELLLLIEQYDKSDLQYAISNCIPIIGCKYRLNKVYQSILLKKLEISHPKTYFSSRNNEFSLINLLSGKKNEDRFVLKMDEGARGLGQCLLTKQEIFDCLFKSNKNLKIELTEEKKIDYSNKELQTEKNDCEQTNMSILPFNERTFLENTKYFNETIKNGNFIVQDYIEKTRELRLLYFYGGEMILIERDINQGWQSNSCITGKGSEINSEQLPEYLVKQIKKLLDTLNYPWLSIDIYQYDQFNWGIIEFQMEFAFEFVTDKNKLCDYMNNSIKNKILDKK